MKLADHVRAAFQYNFKFFCPELVLLPFVIVKHQQVFIEHLHFFIAIADFSFFFPCNLLCQLLSDEFALFVLLLLLLSRLILKILCILHSYLVPLAFSHTNAFVVSHGYYQLLDFWVVKHHFSIPSCNNLRL